jgi:hypothetical protein
MVSIYKDITLKFGKLKHLLSEVFREGLEWLSRMVQAVFLMRYR